MAEMKIVIEESLKRRFKGTCGEKGVTMSDVTVELIKLWLDGQIVLPESEQDMGQDAGQDKQK
ncbi:hypothetical protein H6F43_03535 [Leptolyngbya sp. FACHB-36]|uniref:hypothetical protein n=1 Tax=Leptolyngbya sp. FACHB-36 TaxID=2692808 RepID=UPI0016801960|nr:hypothetical protein [Leptolyngbya sp. FACHB-36]MBD2019254.1 hypothetical protein [Leptolyngbya sp. FACHB-36]